MITLAGFGVGLFIASVLEVMNGRYQVIAALAAAVMIYAGLSLMPDKEGSRAVLGLVIGAVIVSVLLRIIDAVLSSRGGFRRPT